MHALLDQSFSAASNRLLSTQGQQAAAKLLWHGPIKVDCHHYLSGQLVEHAGCHAINSSWTDSELGSSKTADRFMSGGHVRIFTIDCVSMKFLDQGMHSNREFCGTVWAEHDICCSTEYMHCVVHGLLSGVLTAAAAEHMLQHRYQCCNCHISCHRISCEGQDAT